MMDKIMDTLFSILHWEALIIAVILLPVIVGMLLFGLYKILVEEG